MELKKYPIKYALMPVREEIKSNGREYNVALYIVSKCYVINKIRDNGNKDSKPRYEVVFSFSISDDDKITLVLPQYSEKEKCVNSILVDNLFDSFDEALISAKRKNQLILDKKIDAISYTNSYQLQEQVASVRKRHQELLNKYKKIEALNELRTDITISDDRDQQFYEFVRMMVDDPESFYTKVSLLLSSEEKDSLDSFVQTTTDNINNNKVQENRNNLLNQQVTNDRLIAFTKQKVLRANRKYNNV